MKNLLNIELEKGTLMKPIRYLESKIDFMESIRDMFLNSSVANKEIYLDATEETLHQCREAVEILKHHQKLMKKTGMN
ncbi:hypothetical protein [Peribacillus asahii]|uniref:hypothetical protein n=1 Tax=Peribacillus asahii TaxID=228899 RepID=UPI0037F9F2E9